MLRKLTDGIFLGPMPGTTGESVDAWLAQMAERKVTDPNHGHPHQAHARCHSRLQQS